MNRFKTLGIAAVMALALTACAGAGTASASTFESEAENTTWSGEAVNPSGTNHVLVLPKVGGWNSCKNDFSGATSSFSLEALTVKPPAGGIGCVFMGFSSSWNTGACEYKFQPGASSLKGTLSLVNCGAKPLSTNALTPSCLITVGDQNNVGTVEFANAGTGSTRTITATANISGLTYSVSGPCGANGTFSDGTYKGQWKISGSSAGKQVGVWAELPPPPPPTFAAEEGPVTIAGLQSTATKKMTVAGVLTCSKYTLSGTSGSTPFNAITAVPTYSGCTGSSVSVGGCSYVYHAAGTFDIVGATCASNPITILRTECVATIGPQSGLTSFGGIGYKNEGSGKTRSISVSGIVEGVTYTATGAKCPQQGTINTGVINLPTKLTATNSAGKQQGMWVQ